MPDSILNNSPVLETFDPAPSYRKIVADSLAAGVNDSDSLVVNRENPAARKHQITRIFEDSSLLAPFEISGVRQVYSFAGWTWLTCLKAHDKGRPLYYAVFIQDNRVIDVRARVAVDECDKQTYDPLKVELPTLPHYRTRAISRVIY